MVKCLAFCKPASTRVMKSKEHKVFNHSQFVSETGVPLKRSSAWRCELFLASILLMLDSNLFLMLVHGEVSRILKTSYHPCDEVYRTYVSQTFAVCVRIINSFAVILCRADFPRCLTNAAHKVRGNSMALSLSSASCC